MAQEVKHFNARAEPTADFGTNTAGGSVSGRIHGIVSGGMALDPTYDITLGSTDFNFTNSTLGIEQISTRGGSATSGDRFGHWETFLLRRPRRENT